MSDTIPTGRTDALDPEPVEPIRPDDGASAGAAADAPSEDTAPRTRSKGPRSRAEREADREAERLQRAESGDDEKPKRGRPPGGKRPASIEKRLAESITAIAFVVGFFNQADGTVITENAVNLAHALDVLAQDNTQVYRALVAMMSGSAWGGVAMAGFPIVAGIAANHNLGPFGGKSDGSARTESGGSTSDPTPSGAPAGEPFPQPFLHGALVVADRSTP